jgi:hypothetical protein
MTMRMLTAAILSSVWVANAAASDPKLPDAPTHPLGSSLPQSEAFMSNPR